MLRYTIAGLGLAGLAASAVQAAPESLETLLVVGSASADGTERQLPGQAAVSTNELLASSLKDSATLLERLPGVQADSRSNYAQDTRITLRGFGARSAFGVRGIDLRVDGVPVTTPDGQGQLSSVMLDNISAVNVLRGPLAALYGNASGGVIALQTAEPQNTSVAVTAIGGSDGLSKQVLDTQWRQDKLGVRLSASSLEVDGMRPHSAAERRHIHSSLHYQADNAIETIVRFDANRDPRLEDPLGLTPEQWSDDPYQTNIMAERFDTHKSIDHQQASITLRKTTGAQRWQASVWQSDRDMTQFLGFAGDAITGAGGIVALTGAGGIVALQRDVLGTAGRYSRDDVLGATAVTTTFGAEWSRMHDRRRGYVNDEGVRGDLRRDEKGEVESADFYALWQWQLLEPLTVTGGFRYSDIRFDVDDYFIVPGNPDDSGSMAYREWSSALSASWQFDEHWQIYASTGSGFETPTLTESAYRLEGTGLNYALKAADIRQHEGGLRYTAETLQVSASLFDIDTTDEIMVDRSVDGRTIYRNAAATRREGAEIFGQWTPSPHWGVSVTLNWLDARFEAGEWRDLKLPGVARQNHTAQLMFTPWLDTGVSINMLLRHRSQVAADDENTIFAPSANTADIALAWDYPLANWQFRSWLNIANITDKTYVGSVIVNQSNLRAFESAAGRSVSVGVTLGYQW